MKAQQADLGVQEDRRLDQTIVPTTEPGEGCVDLDGTPAADLLQARGTLARTVSVDDREVRGEVVVRAGPDCRALGDREQEEQQQAPACPLQRTVKTRKYW